MLLRLLLGIAVGAGWGFLFWYFGRCDEGVCLFTSSSSTAIAAGAFLGAVWAVWRGKF